MNRARGCIPSTRQTGLTTAEREEFARFRKENRILLEEREYERRRPSSRRSGEWSLRFIAAEKAKHNVRPLCRWLRATRSGYHAWRRRAASAQAKRDQELTELRGRSFEASKRRYGSPRIHEDLRKQQELQPKARHAVDARGRLKARVRKRFKCTTMSDHDQPVAANLLDRQFTADAPNRRWVGDTTEFVVGDSGKLYLAAILDLYSRFVVGWAVRAVNDRHLALKALDMALKRRCPEAGLLHHSDQGCTMRARTTSACSTPTASFAR